MKTMKKLLVLMLAAAMLLSIARLRGHNERPDTLYRSGSGLRRNPRRPRNLPQKRNRSRSGQSAAAQKPTSICATLPRPIRRSTIPSHSILTTI